MKAEINNENKAKFFALYWGQEIGLGLNQQIDTLTGKKWKAQSAFTECIELKSLSSISDEDAEIINTQKAKYYDEDGWYDKHGDFYWWNSDDVDYLRSKGYALPWMGLSINEMIEAGWIKIIE